MVDYAKFGGRVDTGSNDSAQDSAPSSPIDYAKFGGRVEDGSKKSAVDDILQQVQNQPTEQNTPETEGYIQNGLRNAGAGVLNTAQSMLKMSPDLSKMVPSSMQNALLYNPGQRPIDNFDAYKATGTSDQPFSLLPSGEHTLAGGEQALGGLLMPGKFAQEAIPAAKAVAEPITNVLKKMNPEDIATSVQAHHDALESEASNMFDIVGNEAKKRGINKVPVDQDLIEQAKTPGYFPNTQAYRDLIEKASTGDYQAVRDLQSDLGKRARTRLSSDSSAENNQGEEMNELRDQFNNGITHHFQSTGNEDLANTLNSARQKWANLKDLYYNKNLPVGIRKLVDSDSREMPANISNLFSKVSKPMNKLRDQNPFIQNSLNQMQKRDKIINALKYAGSGVAKGLGIASGLEGINLIKNVFSNQEGNH